MQMMMKYFLEDLLFEIFSRYLPVKSLLIFKSVCKSWYLLISSREFIQTHLLCASANAIRQHSITFYWTEDSLRSLFILKSSNNNNNNNINFNGGRSLGLIKLRIPDQTYKLKRKDQNSYSLQPCRGLLLCSTISNSVSSVTYSPHTCSDRLLCRLVVNPATREFHQLPELPCQVPSSSFSRIVYDPNSGSYKVIHVARRFRYCDWSAHVITLGKDASWRKLINFPFKSDVDNDYFHFVFPSLHGIPYQLNFLKDDLRLHVFDAESENFFTIDFKFRGLHCFFSCMAAFRGSLYILDHTGAGNMDVWVMNDYTHQIWVKEEKSFNLKPIICPSDDKVVGDYLFFLVQAVTDDGFVMRLVADVVDRDNISDELYIDVLYAIYNPVNKVWQRFNVSDELDALGHNEWGEFAESLISPKRGY